MCRYFSGRGRYLPASAVHPLSSPPAHGSLPTEKRPHTGSCDRHNGIAKILQTLFYISCLFHRISIWQESSTDKKLSTSASTCPGSIPYSCARATTRLSLSVSCLKHSADKFSGMIQGNHAVKICLFVGKRYEHHVSIYFS